MPGGGGCVTMVPGGVCLWSWGVCFWSGRGGQWGALALGPRGGLPMVPGGLPLVLGGVSAYGPMGSAFGPGGIPACSGADPPVDRIADTSKNITLATTSLRPIMIG